LPNAYERYGTGSGLPEADGPDGFRVRLSAPHFGARKPERGKAQGSLGLTGVKNPDEARIARGGKSQKPDPNAFDWPCYALFQGICAPFNTNGRSPD
jgi:hypothetical protein